MTVNCERCNGDMRCYDSRDYEVLGHPGARRRYRCTTCGHRATSLSFLVFDEEGCRGGHAQRALTKVIRQQFESIDAESLREMLVGQILKSQEVANG